jgi:predicted nucleotidyltransferase
MTLTAAAVSAIDFAQVPSMASIKNESPAADAGSTVQRLAQRFGELPQVVAVVLAGSHAAAASDGESDYDLYVYSLHEVTADFRRALAGQSAEIDNRFWEPGDEWLEPAAGIRLDVMYRSPEWIEHQLDRVLVRQEAAIGYTTCFWYNVVHSEALFDPRGWYCQLQDRARVPYPEGLRRAVVRKNWPILRRNQSSYRRQIELALKRGDGFSVHHRVTALLASFFDVWFAIERQPHPGEKRLLTHLPEPWALLLRAVLEAQPEALLAQIDGLLDRLDVRLVEEGLSDHGHHWKDDGIVRDANSQKRAASHILLRARPPQLRGDASLASHGEIAATRGLGVVQTPRQIPPPA